MSQATTTELGNNTSQAHRRLAAPSVSVVITTYNHAHFLRDALASVMAQTTPAHEVIVVDDGSTDNPANVLAPFPAVKLIQQSNAGLAAARNTGLVAARSTYVLFLDADDLLAPHAIAAGLAAIEAVPQAAFVYGGHRLVDEKGNPTRTRFDPIDGDPFAAMLKMNLIGMHATVLYRREILVEAGGFNVQLRLCEDYDVYLKLARKHVIASHPAVIADYRKHANNVSNDHASMLKAVLAVHASHRPQKSDNQRLQRAWAEGRRNWRGIYAGAAVGAASVAGIGWFRRGLIAASISPSWTARMGSRVILGAIVTAMPKVIGQGISRLLNVPIKIPVGRVKFGDLESAIPISRNFGWDRGEPIDHYYIEQFLKRNAGDIQGRVLEIGDDSYSQMFGRGRIVKQDILHVHAGNPRATIVGDLSMPGVLPEAAFDCIIFTQTLHLIYDMATAMRRLHASLRPGGVLLATVPGISQIRQAGMGRSVVLVADPCGDAAISERGVR